MKLHLGAGNIRLPGFVNIDRIYQPAVDELDNIGILQHQPKGNIDEIYCCHGLDHFDRWTYKTVLRRWLELLKPGGLLRLSTPDWKAAVLFYQATGDLEALTGHLYAGQNYPDNVRHWIWDFKLAAQELTEIGFSDIHVYDAEAWWQVEVLPLTGLTQERDCSTLEWTIETQTNTVRILRSLNITAWKP